MKRYLRWLCVCALIMTLCLPTLPAGTEPTLASGDRQERELLSSLGNPTHARNAATGKISYLRGTPSSPLYRARAPQADPGRGGTRVSGRIRPAVRGKRSGQRAGSQAGQATRPRPQERALPAGVRGHTHHSRRDVRAAGPGGERHIRQRRAAARVDLGCPPVRVGRRR